MSAFVLRREYALQLPNSYVDIDRDEMEYVDGGWSGYVAARNAWGYISKTGTSRALAYSGITFGVVMNWANYSFAAAVSAVGWQAAKIGAIAAGVVGSIVAVSGAGALLWWLGSERRYY